MGSVIGGRLAPTLVFLCASAVAAQPDLTSPLSVLRSAAIYLTDAALHKELKLTAEQINKLRDHRQRYINDNFAARNDAQGREAAGKALEQGLTDTLRPEELKRLREIMIQQLDRRSQSGNFGHTLLRYKELVDTLKLSDDQKSRLQNNELLASVLAADQKIRWQELQGEPFTGQLRLTFTDFPSSPFSRPPPAPSQLECLLQKPVQDEIKLTGEQVQRVTDLEQRRLVLFRNYGQLTSEEQQKKRNAAAMLVERDLEALLSADQHKRLGQITLQEVQRNSGLTAIFTQPSVIQGLQLTQQQQDQLAAHRRERQIVGLQAFTQGGDHDVIARRLADFKKATYEQMVASLSPDQQARLKELLGEPYTGPLQPPAVLPRPGRGTTFPPMPPRLTPQVNQLGYEFLYLRDRNLQTELKLSPEQVQQVLALQAQFTEESRKGAESLGQWTAKVLGDLLQPAQLRRFREIVLQQRERRGGLSAVIAFQGVAEELSLSKEQQDQLRAGKSAAELLTVAQQSKARELLGTPYTGTLNPFGVANGTARTSRETVTSIHLHCLKQHVVQEELKLTAEQAKAIAALFEQHQKALQDIQSSPLGQRANATRERNRQTIQKSEQLLQPQQVKRLRQIVLQQELDNLPTAVASASAMTNLKLSVEQEQQVRALQADADRTRSLLRSELALAAREQADPDETTRRFELGVQERFVKLLTAEQRAKWKELVGVPFMAQIPPIPRSSAFSRPGRS